MSKFILSCLLCALLFVPAASLFTSYGAVTLEGERRQAAARPPLPRKLTAREVKSFFTRLDVFFADRFPLRNTFLSLSKGIHVALKTSLDMEKCYLGKDNWLFLGNSYVRCVDMLQGRLELTGKLLEQLSEYYLGISTAAQNSGAEFFLMIGPNKSTIYPEYLPDVITPSPNRFITPLVASLQRSGVRVYDPTARLREKKSSDLLYFVTDTHWNARGAYEAYEGFREYAGFPAVPSFSFAKAPAHWGDLVDIGGYSTFPSAPEKNIRQEWLVPPVLEEKDGLTKNLRPASDKTIWIFGDSFIGALFPYITATFKETRFFTHDTFAQTMASSLPRPDIILWLTVERSFAPGS